MLNEKKLAFIAKVLAEPKHADIMVGDTTHHETVKVAVSGAAKLVSSQTFCAAIAGLLISPEYDGNLVKELPGIHQWAVEKGGANDFPAEYEPGLEGPIPLGCTKDDRYAFLDQRLNVIKIKTAKQLASTAELLDLGSTALWRSVAFSESSASGYSAHRIADMLIRACLAKGKIDPSRIRGIGVWREKNGGIVRNFSGPVPPRGWYIYTRFEEFEKLDGLPVAASDVLRWLQRFNWKRPHSDIVVLGWLAYAPICGALKQRPHLFLTGAKNTGKTTLLVGIEGLLDPLSLKFDGSVTTEAGIRQKLEENARPIIIDEFENGHFGSRRRIFDLARSAFSANAAGVKGTPSGRHMEFLITSTFLFAGITFTRENAANASRMFVLELLKHDDDPEVGRIIERERQGFIEAQTDWCLRRIEQGEITLAAIKSFETFMPRIESRAKSNLSICFGAAFVALQGREPMEEEIKAWIQKYESVINDHAVEHEQNDSSDCLSHLLSHQIFAGKNVWQVIAEAAKAPDSAKKMGSYQDPLQSYGMRIDGEMLYIADSHSYLEKIFANTAWINGNWKSQLLRSEGAGEAKKYFQSVQKRCVGIPLSALQLDGVDIHHSFSP